MCQVPFEIEVQQSFHQCRTLILKILNSLQITSDLFLTEPFITISPQTNIHQ